jgi:hypothetical protein
MFIPKWLSELFPEQYPQFDAQGHRNVIFVKGNMPGRRDAGKTWQVANDKFLKGFGLVQCSYDPRVFYLVASDGTIIAVIHVDDSRLTYKGKIIERYRAAWAKEFNEELEPLGDTDFTGLRYLFEGEGQARHCKITCIGIIKRLGELLAEHDFPRSHSTETPMTPDDLGKLSQEPGPNNKLRPELLAPARQIAGTIGFIVTQVRIDGYLVFCIIAHYLSEKRLTYQVWVCLLRLGHYLVATIELPLILHRTPPGTEMITFVDSAKGNVDSGRSQGGFFCFVPGSAAPSAYQARRRRRRPTRQVPQS